MSGKRAPVGLIDISVLVAVEEKRPLRGEALPERSAISIVTVAELRAGVLAASDIKSRDRRIATLESASRGVALPVDGPVARAWAAMRAYLAGAGGRVGVNDLWIAATAAAHEIPVVTQDSGFVALSGLMGLTVIEV